MMQSILQLIGEHGLVVVFLNVLIEQAGAPVPAYPVLVITGALLDTSGYSAFALLGVAVFGALLADFGWYLAGRRYGRKMLSMLCRISLSPDSCVRQTESIYLRWGPPSLMVAKFIPGFASIASVLAGAVGTRKRSFLLFDIIGAALWAPILITQASPVVFLDRSRPGRIARTWNEEFLSYTVVEAAACRINCS